MLGSRGSPPTRPARRRASSSLDSERRARRAWLAREGPPPSGWRRGTRPATRGGAPGAAGEGTAKPPTPIMVLSRSGFSRGGGAAFSPETGLGSLARLDQAIDRSHDRVVDVDELHGHAGGPVVPFADLANPDDPSQSGPGSRLAGHLDLEREPLAHGQRACRADEEPVATEVGDVGLVDLGRGALERDSDARQADTAGTASIRRPWSDATLPWNRAFPRGTRPKVGACMRPEAVPPGSAASKRQSPNPWALQSSLKLAPRSQLVSQPPSQESSAHADDRIEQGLVQSNGGDSAAGGARAALAKERLAIEASRPRRSGTSWRALVARRGRARVCTGRRVDVREARDPLRGSAAGKPPHAAAPLLAHSMPRSTPGPPSSSGTHQ